MNVLPNQQNEGITAAPENLVNQLWNRMGWHASTPPEVWADLSTLATENQCSDMLDDMLDSGT